MRLFAAVLPPAPATDELAGAVARLRQIPGADRLRWTGRDGWHLTLAFYGEVPEATLPELHERLARAAHRRARHELRMVRGGRFADRVLWAGAEGGLTELRRLADSASAAGRRVGVPMDEHRPYTPHLTLARNRTGQDLAPFVAALDEFAGTPWTVGELALVRSHPPEAGVAGRQPRYETVAVWPLGHGPAAAADRPAPGR